MRNPGWERGRERIRSRQNPPSPSPLESSTQIVTAGTKGDTSVRDIQGKTGAPVTQHSLSGQDMYVPYEVLLSGLMQVSMHSDLEKSDLCFRPFTKFTRIPPVRVHCSNPSLPQWTRAVTTHKALRKKRRKIFNSIFIWLCPHEDTIKAIK